MLINPTKLSLNLAALKKKAKSLLPNKERKEIPGINEVYSEQNFIELKVKTRSNASIKLMTYREQGKGLLDPKKPRALMIKAHGLFGHQDSEALVVKQFAEYGITSVGFDYRGHGRSEGTPGLIENFTDSVTDMLEFIKLLDEIYDKDIPRFYCGLSLGGVIGYMLGLRIPDYFKGMILLAPALQVNDHMKPILTISKYFCCCLSSLPPMPVDPNKSDAVSNLTSNEKWINDPLGYHGGIKIRTVHSLGEQNTFCNKRNYNKFKVPFVVVIGSVDKLVDVEACVDFYELADTKDKQLVFIPGMWHVVHHEEKYHEISDFCIKWIEEKIGVSKEQVEIQL